MEAKSGNVHESVAHAGHAGSRSGLGLAARDCGGEASPARPWWSWSWHFSITEVISRRRPSAERFHLAASDHDAGQQGLWPVMVCATTSTLDFIGIPSRNAERSRSFYVDTLGLRADEHARFEVWIGETCFGIWEPERLGMAFAAQSRRGCERSARVRFRFMDIPKSGQLSWTGRGTRRTCFRIGRARVRASIPVPALTSGIMTASYPVP